MPIVLLSSSASIEPATLQQPEFVAFLILAAVSVGASILFVLLSHVFGGHRYSDEKFMAYECGIKDVGEDLGKRIPVKFFRIAILFVLFSIEVILLFPWAIILNNPDYAVRVFLFFEVLIFAVVLILGFIYALKRNAFKWD